VSAHLTDAQISVLLSPIKPGRVAKREGLSNVEGYDIRAHLTRLFGFGRWDDISVNPTTMLYEQETTTKAGKPAFKVAYRAERALVVRDVDGNQLCRYEGSAVGESTMPDFKRGDAHDMAIKTAETQALKRAAVNLGDQFGLSLYAKGNTGALVGKVVGFEAGHQRTVEMHEPDVVSGYDPDTGDTDEPDEPSLRASVPTQHPPAPESLAVEAEALPLDAPATETFQVTAPQIKKMQTLFGVMGVKDREAKVAYLSKHAGRTVASSKELTLQEAKRVIEQMEQETSS
jgi:hypothetical protein